MIEEVISGFCENQFFVGLIFNAHDKRLAQLVEIFDGGLGMPDGVEILGEVADLNDELALLFKQSHNLIGAARPLCVP